MILAVDPIAHHENKFDEDGQDTTTFPGPRLEVTLESLHGILWSGPDSAEAASSATTPATSKLSSSSSSSFTKTRKNRSTTSGRSKRHNDEPCPASEAGETISNNPKLTEGEEEGEMLGTAVVSFAGSVPHMQISSHRICPATGQLLVESLPMTTTRRRKTKSRESSGVTADTRHSAQPLSAYWGVAGPENTRPSELPATSPSPHVTVQLPRRDTTSSRWPLPLAKTNRDARILDDLFPTQRSQSLNEDRPATATPKLSDRHVDDQGPPPDLTLDCDTESTGASAAMAVVGTDSEAPPLSPPPILWQRSNGTITSSSQLKFPTPLRTPKSTNSFHRKNRNSSGGLLSPRQLAFGGSDDVVGINQMTPGGRSGVTDVWSPAGAALPEILELHIRLKCPQLGAVSAPASMTMSGTYSTTSGNRQQNHNGLQDADANLGIAYLVLFGGHPQDYGTKIMELPVRQRRRPVRTTSNSRTASFFSSARGRSGSLVVGSGDSHDSTGSACLTFAPDARIRVKVKMIPQEDVLMNFLSGRTSVRDLGRTRTGSPTCDEVFYSRSVVEKQMEPFMDMIHEREKEESDYGYREAQKRSAMEILVPGQHTMDDAQADGPVFCDMFNWRNMVRSVYHAVQRCDARTAGGVAAVGPSGSSLADSTIATRDSWGI